MTRRILIVAAAAAWACSDDPGPGGGPDAATSGPVRLSGAVEKGPFVLGSTVAVSATDALGNPTGQVFNTQTTNDLGAFRVDFDYRGFVSMEGTGYYYNEVLGRLSNASLTLRAYYDVAAGGDQAAYVNVVTHLSHPRVKRLLGDGVPFVSAVAQAEQELRFALGIGPAGFDPGAGGIAMNIAGGDTDANAYLFAVSVVLAQRALIGAGPMGPVDATLQEGLNELALDLSDDGQLQPGVVGELEAAEAAVDAESVMLLLAARLADVGSTAAVPDLHRILDSDLDGVVNASDNCRLIANPDQTPTTGICSWRTVKSTVSGVGPGAAGLLVGDFTEDGKGDLLFKQGNSVAVMAGDDAGGFVGPFASTLPGTDTPVPPVAADFDGDGVLDVAVVLGQSVVLAYGDGAGRFDGPVTVDLGSGIASAQLAVGQLDGDTALDLVVAGTDTPTMAGAVAVLLGDGAGSLLAPTTVVTATGPLVALALGDFTGDSQLDVAAVGGSPAAGGALLPGDGAGGLGPETWLTTSGGGVAAGDIDADGRTDLVVVGTSAVELFFGEGAALTPAVSTPTGGAFLQLMRLADFTGDGGADIVATTMTGPLVLWESDGRVLGTLHSFDLVSLGGLIAVGDLSGDGDPDVAVSAGTMLGVLFVNP